MLKLITQLLSQMLSGMLVIPFRDKLIAASAAKTFQPRERQPPGSGPAAWLKLVTTRLRDLGHGPLAGGILQQWGTGMAAAATNSAAGTAGAGSKTPIMPKAEFHQTLWSGSLGMLG